MTLPELSIKHNADKKIHAGLLEQYELFLPKKCKKFLEIGSLHGNSARMFKEWYGEKAEYHLLDLFSVWDEENAKTEGFHTYRGSQSNIDLLKSLPQDIDVVSDDGSHHSDEQLITFKFIFKERMSNGGLYVVEDCYGHIDPYWRRNIIEKPEDTIVGIAKRFLNGEDISGQFIDSSEAIYIKEYVKDIKIHNDITVFIWKK